MNRTNSSNCNKYNTHNPLKRYLIAKFMNRLAGLCSLSGRERVCDIGCGEGFVDKFLIDRYPSLDIEGYDMDPAAVNCARKAVSGVEFNVLKVEEATLLKGRRYDLVLLLEVLEHLHDHNNALENLNELDFDRIIISVPNEPWFSLGNLMFGKNIPRFGRDPEHVNFWHADVFLKLLSGFFEIIKVAKPFPWMIVECKKRTNVIMQRKG